MRFIIAGMALAFISSTTSAQTPAPSGTDPTAPAGQDWAAIKAAAEAQKAAYDALTAASNSEKASTEARQAAKKAKIGTVEGQTEIKGEVTANTGTAKAEALLMVTRSTLQASTVMAANLSPSMIKDATRTILILTDTNQLATSDAILFDLQIAVVKTAIEVALRRYADAKANDITIKAPGSTDGGPGRIAILPAAGSVIDSLAKLGSYFQANYAFSEVTVDAAPNLVATALVDSLRRANVANPLILPANFVASDATAVTDTLTPMQINYMTLIGQQSDAKARALVLREAEDKDGEEAASRYEMADASAGKAISAFEGLMTRLVAAPADTEPFVVRIIRQKKIQTAIAANPLVLLLDGKQAAAFYTKRSLWTFLGGPPLYVMGGVSMTYALYEPSSGHIQYAGAIAKHGGYRSVRNVERLFQ